MWVWSDCSISPEKTIFLYFQVNCIWKNSIASFPHFMVKFTVDPTISRYGGEQDAIVLFQKVNKLYEVWFKNWNFTNAQSFLTGCLKIRALWYPNDTIFGPRLLIAWGVNDLSVSSQFSANCIVLLSLHLLFMATRPAQIFCAVLWGWNSIACSKIE
jgi:hypothetical protein